MSRRKSLSADCINLMKPAKISASEEEEGLIKEHIDYEKELIFYFYNAMLENIVQKWDVNVDDTTDSIPSGDEIICSKPYEPYSVAIEEETKDETPPISHRKPSRRLSDQIHASIHEKRRSLSKQGSLEAISIADIRKNRKGLHKRSVGRFKLKKPKSKIFTLKSISKTHVEEHVEVDRTDDWILKSEKETVDIKFVNGNQYIGEIYKKIMHGTGQFKWADGTTYTGDFKNGEMTGRGRIEFADKSVYEGEIYKGFIHGHGNAYKSFSEAAFSGEYYLSLKHGEGRMMFGKNNYYKGPWEMDKRVGKGLRHYGNGAKYYGDWVDGKRHGFGTTVFNNNDFYHGDWKNGTKHGYGEYIWNAFSNNYLCVPVQNKYCGMWDHDFKHGFGLLYFGVDGGARLAGTFYRNIKHGAGIVVCNNGNVIKADPLFVNDKSVRFLKESIKTQSSVKKSNSSDGSENLEPNHLINSCTNMTCSNLEPRIYEIMPQHKLKQQSFSNIHHFVFPCYGFERDTVARINQYELIYSNDFKIECESMTINLSSSECVDLTKIINEVAAKYLYIVNNTHNKENTNSIKKRYFQDFKVWPCLVSEHFCEDYVFDRFNKSKECENFFILEERRVRKAINMNLHYLLELYDYYAFVTCIQDTPSYKPWLMRICMWQLFIDCNMTYKNITLNDIDEMMAEHSSIQVADIHNPFDIIYFWQFLMCIITLAWRLYGNDYMNIKTNGILEKAFNKFLATDIFPNARKHKGTALFEYKDVIPLTAAFEWYKSFGPNFTVYDFLKFSSSLHRNRPPGYYQEIGVKIPKIQFGENMAFVSDKIIYREVQSYVLGNKKYNYPVVYAHTHGYYLKSLKYLFLLGGRRVLTILKEICPMIAVQDEYIDMNHVLSFLEFYEAVLRCTQEKVNEDKRVRAKSSLDIENRRTVYNFCSEYSKSKTKSSKHKKLGLCKDI